MAASIGGLARRASQQQTLRLLISNIGSRTLPHSSPTRFPPRTFLTSSRCMREAVSGRSDEGITQRYTPLDQEVAEEQEKDDQVPMQENEDTTTPTSSSDSHVPWYLQVQQSPQPFDSPMTARQQLPPLPTNPPSLLQPLLQHVSVELGMDDLSLLDLRTLDPPPALGANLLMIIGTARSEKHLHVSADRLCRWLRTEYKLRPYADGLLGRNELKLKIRRRAKRTRMLSAVGAKATANTEIDEGIRTGWVCVNVGRVEGGEVVEAEQQEEVVGFGTRVSGCNIVVQMLTEEKRGVVDLEKLWTGILKRSKRHGEAALVEDVDAAEELASLDDDISQPSSSDVRAA